MNKIKDNEKLLLQSLCHIAVIKSLLASKNVNYEDFIKDYNLLEIILFHLIQIGEIAGKFSEDFCIKNEQIDFKGIKGLRNLVVHDYAGVVYNEIFDVIKNDIPELEKDYRDILIKNYEFDNDTINNYMNYYVNNRLYNF